MVRKCSLPLILLFVLLGTSAYASGDPDRLHMSIGDPARNGRDVSIVLDAIVDTHTGDQLAADDLADRLANVRLLLVGESHTAAEAHRVEARVIELLARRGRHVFVGLEMYPYTQQRWLDAWNTNLVTEPQFVELSHWYRYWGFPWPYYRDVFLAARSAGAQMVALNAPIEVVRAVRDKGLSSLTADDSAHIPPRVDVDDPDQLRLFKASFPAGDSIHAHGSDESWKRMLAAQATWDATMGFNAVKALDAANDEKAIMVVIAGSGHVEYGLGIQRQARQWFKGPVATLIPVPVRQHGGAPSVRASYADYVWGVPSEIYPAYPDLGISTGRNSVDVLQVDPGSPADQAGIRAGDKLVSLDGSTIADDETFNRVMATKRWGDAATLVLRRGTETVTVRAEFRRAIPTAIVATRQQ